MKKPYSLDYSIERDTDRLKAVEDILDKLDKNPSPTELEQMGSYILYGKDENGKNAYQRGEMLRDARYNTFRTKEETNTSLDALLENPLADQQDLDKTLRRDPYVRPTIKINRPKYDKNGTLIDIGDADIPGMEELWKCIDNAEHRLAVLEGKTAPQEGDTVDMHPYQVFKLRHALIDLRKHQYYLKDAYKPCIHFLNVQHPRRQYINWNSDTFYWISREEWEKRVNSSFFPLSKNINDYETKNEGKEVKWVVRRHTFDWENITHIRAFINNYESLHNLLWDKLDTVGHTLLMDFERYRKLCNFSPVREDILNMRIYHYTSSEIATFLSKKYNIVYQDNHISSILANEIPKRFIAVVQKERLLQETPPSQRQICKLCGKLLPLHTLFFSINNSRSIGFSNTCKECEKAKRLGGQPHYDRRNKETKMR